MLNEEDVEVLEARYNKAIEAYSQRDSIDQSNVIDRTRYEVTLLNFVILAQKAVIDLDRYIADLKGGVKTDCDVANELFESESDRDLWFLRVDEVTLYLATT